MKVSVATVFEILEKNGLSLSQSELAEIFGVQQGAISRRIKRNSPLTVDEVVLIKNKFPNFTKLLFEYLGGKFPDAVEIKYYDNKEYSHLIKCEKITSIWNDRELTCDVWRDDVEHLRIVTMAGDYMAGTENSIPDGTHLIIDITSTDINRSGIYAYITNAGFFINQIKLKANGNVDIINFNQNCGAGSTYLPSELKEMGFKVIGRVIKALNRE